MDKNTEWVQAWNSEEIENWAEIEALLKFILKHIDEVKHDFVKSSWTAWTYRQQDGILCLTPPVLFSILAEKIKVIPYPQTKSIVMIFYVFGERVFLRVTSTGIKADPATYAEKKKHTNETDVVHLVYSLLSGLSLQIEIYQSIK